MNFYVCLLVLKTLQQHFNVPRIYVALTGLQGTQCFAYLDDIVIFASSLQQHSVKLQAVFDRLLRINQLLLEPDKCEFLRKEVIYLGHVINEKGIFPKQKN